MSPGGDAARVLGVLAEALAAPVAPTTVADPARDHIADSLVALELECLRSARVLADLGSGPGVPGLVLAAVLPSCEVVCVESVGHKAEFIRATAARCGLGNVRVVVARAEEWDAGRGVCDVVTARALASLSVICEYAAPLLREGGCVVAWKGEVSDEEEADGRAAAAVLGLSPPVARPVQPYPGALHRTLWTAFKVAETPAKFPRRAGIATKRPLSANP